MLSPFTLPSNAEVDVVLREATVQESIDFSSVMPEHEEALTTRFLNAVQDPARYTDCRTWTADDRRFALYWYYLHTNKDTGLSLPYECPHCQETHVCNFNLRTLADDYQQMQGKPYRDIDFQEYAFRVAPHDGHAVEALEGLRLALTSYAPDSTDYKRQQAEIRFQEVLHALSDRRDFEKVPQLRRKTLENKLRSMTMSVFRALADLVEDSLDDMEHGLPTVIVDGQILLIAPEHGCPVKASEGKEVVTVLRIPFRDCYDIPRL